MTRRVGLTQIDSDNQPLVTTAERVAQNESEPQFRRHSITIVDSEPDVSMFFLFWCTEAASECSEKKVVQQIPPPENTVLSQTAHQTECGLAENEDSDIDTVANNEAADACEESGAEVATRRRRLRTTWRDAEWMQNLAMRVEQCPSEPPSQPSSDDNGDHHSTFLLSSGVGKFP